jgi:hypothetical protein
MPASNRKELFCFVLFCFVLFLMLGKQTNSEVLSVSPQPRITFSHQIVWCWSNCYKSTARERPPKHSPPGRPKIDLMSPGLTPALPIPNTPNIETACRVPAQSPTRQYLVAKGLWNYSGPKESPRVVTKGPQQVWRARQGEGRVSGTASAQTSTSLCLLPQLLR